MSQDLSPEIALRIGLASRELPDTDPSRLLNVLIAQLGLPLTEQKLATLKVSKLKSAAEGELESIEIQYLKKALNYLKGVGVQSDTIPLPEVQPYAEGDMPGSIRVACASNSGNAIDGHFGSCARFLVYQISDLEARLIEIREVSGIDKEAEDKNIARAGIIADCQLLYTISIGGPAAAKVVRAGLHPVKLPTGGDAAAVLGGLCAVIGGNPPPWLAKAMGVAPEDRYHFQGEDDEPEQEEMHG